MNKSERDEKKLAKLEKEIERMKELSRYEYALYAQGKTLVAGIDEVGRGPLAGPVLACAVILPHDLNIMGIDDSKKLSEKKREALYEEICEQAVAIGIGAADHIIIDEINILQATYQAMRIAIGNLAADPENILIDALTIPGVKVPQLPIIHGDAKSVSIAAASIVAKVTRDRLMREYHELWPEYGFDRNKGYGTKEHMEAIRKYGLCRIHRRSFTKNLAEERMDSHEDY